MSSSSSHTVTMGANTSALTDEQLKQYQHNTSFSRTEICHLWNKFYKLCDINEKIAKGQSNSIRASFDQIKAMPELKENPFNQRICEVFSTPSEVILDGEDNSADDKANSLSFENFLDMVYIFSEQASLEEKIKYAFKIYDEDDDGYIGRDDLHSIVTLMTKKQNSTSGGDQGSKNDDYLTDQEITIIADKIIEESDVDHDQRLSAIEFGSIVLQAPHFINTFHIRF